MASDMKLLRWGASNKARYWGETVAAALVGRWLRIWLVGNVKKRKQSKQNRRKILLIGKHLLQY